MILHDSTKNGTELDPLRIGIPTGSSASKLVTSKGEISKSLDGYAYELAQARDKGKSVSAFAGTKYTRLGHEREPMTKAWYEFTTDYDTLVPGFVTPDSMEYGCTPDLLVYEKGAAPAAIDTKFIGISQIKNCDKQHGKYLSYVSKNSSAPTEHFAQCQFEMLVTETEWNDLCYYHPVLDPFVVRVYRDDLFCRKLIDAIKICCAKRDEYITDIRKDAKRVHEKYQEALA